jgi:hypothetical protein
MISSRITRHCFLRIDLAGIGVIQNSIYPVVNYIRNITISQNTVFMSQADACLRLNGSTNNNILISNNVFYCGNQKSITSSTSLTGKLRWFCVFCSILLHVFYILI